MGHVGFYNSLLVAMGNVVSALLMCALQAAWLCQRLIDQDYRQNHGSRLTPILPNKELENSIEFGETTPVIVLPANFHHEMEYPMERMAKTRKFETNPGLVEPSGSGSSHRSSSMNRRRKYGHARRKHYSNNDENERLTFSQPYLENVSDALTFEYVNRVGQVLGLRRAFSDINISSSVDSNFCQINENCPVANMNETRTAITDQDFFRLIFTKGYVT